MTRAIDSILRYEFILNEEPQYVNVISRLNTVLESKIVRMSEQKPWKSTDDLRTEYLKICNQLIRNLDYAIRYLQPGNSSEERTDETDLSKLCECMKNHDRENFLQYLLKIKEGTISVPAFPKIG